MEEQLEHVEVVYEGLAARDQFLRTRGAETLGDETVAGRYGFLHALYQQVLYERLGVRCWESGGQTLPPDLFGPSALDCSSGVGAHRNG